MSHRKAKHPKNIKVCRYFEKEMCDFDKNDCWWSHDTKARNSSIPQTLQELKCSFCEMKFNTESLFLKHRRENHPQNISECRDGDFCKFGVKCWYRHTENQTLK